MRTQRNVRRRSRFRGLSVNHAPKQFIFSTFRLLDFPYVDALKKEAILGTVLKTIYMCVKWSLLVVPVAYRGGLGCSNPPPEIPKALQEIVPNLTRLWKLLKKKLLNLGRQHTKMFGKKAVTF